MSKTKTIYKVTFPDGCALAQEGYSQYHDRKRRWVNYELPEGEEVYGLEQAKDHAREFLLKDDEYNATRRAQSITIKAIVTSEENVERITWDDVNPDKGYNAVDLFMREGDGNVGTL